MTPEDPSSPSRLASQSASSQLAMDPSGARSSPKSKKDGPDGWLESTPVLQALAIQDARMSSDAIAWEQKRERVRDKRWGDERHTGYNRAESY